MLQIHIAKHSQRREGGCGEIFSLTVRTREFEIHSSGKMIAHQHNH